MRDGQLVARLAEMLEHMDGDTTVTIDRLTKSIRDLYPDYKRRQWYVLREQVERAYLQLTDGAEPPVFESPPPEPVRKKVTEKPEKKRRKVEDQLDLISRKTAFKAVESTVTLSDLGGISHLESSLRQVVEHVTHPDLFETLGVHPPRGILVLGPPGSGKTLLAHALAGEFHRPLVSAVAPELISGISGSSESQLRNLFEAAAKAAPCLLFLDELDCLAGRREDSGRELERRLVAQLSVCIDSLPPDVILVGATSRPEALDPGLRRAGRFDREISLGIPQEHQRTDILRVLCQKLTLSPICDLTVIAHLTPGYVGADLKLLTQQAACVSVECWLAEKDIRVESENAETICIKQEHFVAALKHIQPSAKREGFATVPETTWDDVGALADIRGELYISIMAPIKHREAFEQLGLSTPPGILLYGPPGCGKTLLAKAVANESGLNFLAVSGPELLNMYVGESERAVRQVFERARQSAPCVLFFDELDSLAPRRSGSAHESSARLVNQLLTEMDGLLGRGGVYIIAATNRPDMIDPAILRPGRFDKLLYVGLPCSEDQLEILNAVTKRGTKPPCQEGTLEEVVEALADRNFTGADLAALVREAASLAFKASLETSVIAGAGDRISVNISHFRLALSNVTASVSEDDVRKFSKMREKLRGSHTAPV